MNNQVLVLYATQHGATAEIAERIGEALRLAGLSTDVRPVDRLTDVTPYKAVVLGSAVYAGHWREEAAEFLEANERKLARKPVWFFSSGPTGQGDPVRLMKGWRFPEGQQACADRIGPRDTAVFHGALDMAKLNLAEKLLVKGIKAPLGDFRDWEAVTTWAGGIAEELKKETPPASDLGVARNPRWRVHG